VFESLIKSGAMDSLGPREAMAASVDDATPPSSGRRGAGNRASMDCSSAAACAPKSTFVHAARCAPWSEEERLASEYRHAGLLRLGPSARKYSSRLTEWGLLRLEEVEGQRNGGKISVAALIVGCGPMRSKKGRAWGIFTLQDMTGVQELLAFPRAFAKHEQILKPGTPLLLKVRVQIEEAGTRLSLQEARRLEDIVGAAAAKQEFRVRLPIAAMSEETLDRWKNCLQALRE
jgi:DNA polymerase-3 subunit alpha